MLLRQRGGQPITPWRPNLQQRRRPSGPCQLLHHRSLSPHPPKSSPPPPNAHSISLVYPWVQLASRPQTHPLLLPPSQPPHLAFWRSANLWPRLLVVRRGLMIRYLKHSLERRGSCVQTWPPSCLYFFSHGYCSAPCRGRPSQQQGDFEKFKKAIMCAVFGYSKAYAENEGALSDVMMKAHLLEVRHTFVFVLTVIMCLSPSF